MKRMFTSCFGLGLMPIAPGTWGSLPPVVIFAILARLEVPAVTVVIVMAALAVLGSYLCVHFSPAIMVRTAHIDPHEVVIDEFAGQAITFMIAGGFAIHTVCATAIYGFLLFRIFDIIKPWPCHRLEKLPHGWGILADDIFAGIYAGLLVLVFSKIGLLNFTTDFVCNMFSGATG